MPAQRSLHKLRTCYPILDPNQAGHAQTGYATSPPPKGQPMWIPDLYRATVDDVDDAVTEVRVIRGHVRVMTGHFIGAPVWLTPEQATALRDRIDEAIWLATVLFDGQDQRTEEEVRQLVQS